MKGWRLFIQAAIKSDDGENAPDVTIPGRYVRVQNLPEGFAPHVPYPQSLSQSPPGAIPQPMARIGVKISPEVPPGVWVETEYGPEWMPRAGMKGPCSKGEQCRPLKGNPVPALFEPRLAG